MIPAEKKQELEQILQDLQTRVEGLEQIVILQQDGTLIAGNISARACTPEMITTMTAFAALIDETCQTLQGEHGSEALIRGQQRFLAMYKTHRADMFLAIIGQASVNFGLLNSGCRITIKKLEDLVGAFN